MKLEISSAAIDAMVREADAAPGREVCGLLLGRGLCVTQVVPSRNVADDPATGFEIDPVALLRAHRRARAGDPGIVGCYHSHPNGEATPSVRDAEAWQDDMIWIIIANGSAVAWRKAPGGRFNGPSEPIDFIGPGDGCTIAAASPEGDTPKPATGPTP